MRQEMTGLYTPASMSSPSTETGKETSIPGPPETLLVVDSDPVGRQLFRGVLKAAQYRILAAADVLEAIAILKNEKVDLVITDLVLRDLSGLDLCRKLRAERSTRLMPILVVTSVQTIESEIAGLDSGASEFLVKPISPMALRTRIRAMLRTKHVIDSLDEAESILFAMARIVDTRDSDTGDHCERLAELSVLIGSEMGLPAGDLNALRQGGYLHDIGKVATPDAILFKRGPLNNDEWAIMRQHTTVGESICRPMRSLRPVLPIIRHHHERWDGSGYPDGLCGEQIPLLARILQVADIYDAITSRRSYKPALGPDEALDIMRQEVDRGWRDPALFGLFLNIIKHTREDRRKSESSGGL
jgi:putative two-component system response regulator